MAIRPTINVEYVSYWLKTGSSNEVTSALHWSAVASPVASTADTTVSKCKSSGIEATVRQTYSKSFSAAHTYGKKKSLSLRAYKMLVDRRVARIYYFFFFGGGRAGGTKQKIDHRLPTINWKICVIDEKLKFCEREGPDLMDSPGGEVRTKFRPVD